MYYKEDLIRHIKALGVQPGDTVLVHTSLKAVGEIAPEGKTTAEVFIDALRECVPEGLLLIPSHTWANVREDGAVFDVRETMPCIGAVPTAAVKLAAKARGEGIPGCIRSLHPTHSMVAFGKDAETYVRLDDAAETPAAWEGCYGRLYEQNAKILLVGVNHGRNTFFHAVDELLDVKNRLCEHQTRLLVRDYSGAVTSRSVYRHARSMSQYFMNYEPYLDQTGAVSYGRLGDALVRVCDVRKCTHAVQILWAHADHDLCEKDERLDIRGL